MVGLRALLEEWPMATSRGRAAATWGGRATRLDNQEIGYWTTESRAEIWRGEESFQNRKVEGTSKTSVPWSQD